MLAHGLIAPSASLFQYPSSVSVMPDFALEWVLCPRPEDTNAAAVFPSAGAEGLSLRTDNAEVKATLLFQWPTPLPRRLCAKSLLSLQTISWRATGVYSSILIASIPQIRGARDGAGFSARSTALPRPAQCGLWAAQQGTLKRSLSVYQDSYASSMCRAHSLCARHIDDA